MSIDLYNEQMRDFMLLVEAYAAPEESEPLLESLVSVQSQPQARVLTEMNDLVFKLRSYTEQNDGERSLGIEEGMQLAADMIENLIRRQAGE